MLELNDKASTSTVFIIDRARKLRGRDDDEEGGYALWLQHRFGRRTKQKNDRRCQSNSRGISSCFEKE